VIVQLLRQLLHYKESTFYPRACCDYTLALLLWEIAKQGAGEPVGNALAERVHEYVRSHTDTLLTVADVETHFGYNADYLSRILKTHRGRSLQQDIIAERLDRAKVLLQTSNYTVEAVARLLGYEDANLFSKFFRYHEGTTPTAYRNTYTKRPTNHK
jgi:YesN/AraC family two-component response regulator